MHSDTLNKHEHTAVLRRPHKCSCRKESNVEEK